VLFKQVAVESRFYKLTRRHIDNHHVYRDCKAETRHGKFNVWSCDLL